jgi:hypothetical protein
MGEKFRHAGFTGDEPGNIVLVELHCRIGFRQPSRSALKNQQQLDYSAIYQHCIIFGGLYGLLAFGIDRYLDFVSVHNWRLDKDNIGAWIQV